MSKFIFVYIISLLAVQSVLAGTVKDSVPVKTYGLRVGVEILHPIEDRISGQNPGFEIRLDYPLGNSGFLSLDGGFQDHFNQEERFDYRTKGNFFRLGYDRNIYENFPGLHHEITAGLHYGWSLFSQELKNFTAGNEADYFGSTMIDVNRKYESLQAHWLSFRFGIRAEVLPRFFLGTGVELNKLLYADSLDNFENLYIPGFYDVLPSGGGFAFFYTLSYSFPVKF